MHSDHQQRAGASRKIRMCGSGVCRCLEPPTRNVSGCGCRSSQFYAIGDDEVLTLARWACEFASSNYSSQARVCPHAGHASGPRTASSGELFVVQAKAWRRWNQPVVRPCCAAGISESP